MIPSGATKQMARTPALFDHALAELGHGNGIWGPFSFKDYAARAAITASRSTPEYISVDHFHRLPSALKRADAMVLRLGDALGTGTQFALVRVQGRLDDFFLFDDIIFEGIAAETYLPTTSLRQLYPFALLKTLAETNLVNLAFASGALNEALGLDDDQLVMPATGRNRYSFTFRPHSTLSGVVEHRRGQVEIDALFVARRLGRQCLYVVEAKVGPANGSLAKHKLLYGRLPCRKETPSHMPVIPVYLKLSPSDNGLIFNVAECEPVEHGVTCLDALAVRNVRRLIIPSQMLALV